jgi:hypothetical protein
VIDKIRKILQHGVHEFVLAETNRVRWGVLLRTRKEAEARMELYLSQGQDTTSTYPIRGYYMGEMQIEAMCYMSVMDAVIDNSEDYLITLRQVQVQLQVQVQPARTPTIASTGSSSEMPFESLRSASAGAEKGAKVLGEEMCVSSHRSFSLVLDEFEAQIEARRVSEDAFFASPPHQPEEVEVVKKGKPQQQQQPQQPQPKSSKGEAKTSKATNPAPTVPTASTPGTRAGRSQAGNKSKSEAKTASAATASASAQPSWTVFLLQLSFGSFVMAGLYAMGSYFLRSSNKSIASNRAKKRNRPVPLAAPFRAAVLATTSSLSGLDEGESVFRLQVAKEDISLLLHRVLTRSAAWALVTYELAAHQLLPQFMQWIRTSYRGECARASDLPVLLSELQVDGSMTSMARKGKGSSSKTKAASFSSSQLGLDMATTSQSEAGKGSSTRKRGFCNKHKAVPSSISYTTDVATTISADGRHTEAQAAQAPAVEEQDEEGWTAATRHK